MKILFLTALLGAATLVNAQTTKDNLSVQESKQTERMAAESQQFNSAEELAKGLAISQADAEQVWSKYTAYKAAKKDLMEKKRETMKSIKSGSEKMSDQDYEKAYRTNLETQRKRLDLDESYYDQFLQIIPASKVHQLLMSDRADKKHLRRHQQKPEQTRTRMKQAE